MRQGMRGAVLGAMLLPGAALAGTPGQEADRCSRILDGMAHGDPKTMLDVMMERYRPGEVPERYVQQQRLHLDAFAAQWAGRGGVKATEALPDVTVPVTGDILRRQKWTDGAGKTVYIGCALFPGTEEPWPMSIILSDSDEGLIGALSGRVAAGKDSD